MDDMPENYTEENMIGKINRKITSNYICCL